MDVLKKPSEKRLHKLRVKFFFFKLSKDFKNCNISLNSKIVKVVVVDGVPRIVLFAKKAIIKGAEITFNYGEK